MSPEPEDTENVYVGNAARGAKPHWSRRDQAVGDPIARMVELREVVGIEPHEMLI